MDEEDSDVFEKLTSAVGGAIDKFKDTSVFINCTLEIENLTKFRLSKPKWTLHHGQMSDPPSTVLPSAKHEMVFCKTQYAIYGTSGVVSWLIEGCERRLVVMWFVPFIYINKRNWFAVGITNEGKPLHKHSWYSDINERRDANTLKELNMNPFCEKCSFDDINVGRFEIEGTMGTKHGSKIKIVISTPRKTRA